ncbi:MAG: OmpH family outer membrane protein [Deltaproteobacteria bacterium]|jgi:outer membrane protein|nr:OmpH family outer membrane protein [Deltaproteobacteria bacterium]
MRKFSSAAVAAVMVMAAYLLCPAVQAAAQTNVAIFDLGRVIADSKRGKEAQNKIKAKEDSLKKNLEPRAENLQKKRADLEKAMTTLSQEAFEKRRDELAKEYSAFAQDEQKAAEDFQKTQNDTMKPLLERIQRVVGDIAKDRGFDLVIDGTGGGVIYAVSSMDITDDVIKAVDK